MNYDKPILTVDVVALRLHEGQLEVALAPRKEAPFEGLLALPGGFVHTDKDESTDATALRVLSHKFSFVPTHLEQVYTISGAGRDPRGWSASVVYLALLSSEQVQALSQSVPGLIWASVEQPLPPTAFDHGALVRSAVERLRSKAQYSTIVAHLLPTTFVMSELHDAYQHVLKRRLDPANFRRKMLELGGLTALGVQGEEGQRGRPSTRYQLASELSYFDRTLA